MIKPEAMKRRNAIRELIESSGLRIISQKTTILPESAIDTLYPTVAGELRDATLYYLSVGPSEIGVVEGSNAIARLCDLAGESVDPAKCRPATIRARFGHPTPVKMGKAIYFLNGFHRSQNTQEVKREMALFQSLPSTY